MSTKNIFIVAVISAIILSGIGLFNVLTSNYNKEKEISNLFKGKLKEREAFYEMMSSIISQKVQVTKANKEAFKENINIIMSNRKDSEQVFFKWVTESNPNASYKEVADLYKDLSRVIESKKEGFFMQEKVLIDIKVQHDNLITKFPNNIYFKILGIKEIEFEPIKSSITKEVFETGIDDNKDIGIL